MTADWWLLFKPEGILQRAPVSANQLALIKMIGDEGHTRDTVIALPE